MDIQLKVLVGSAVGQKINVPGPKFYIGRAEDCQLRPRSDLISRHHCAIIVEDDYVAVRDFGSRNGSFVNDTRVSGEKQLNHGDKLVVGPLEFEVCLVQAATPSKKRPKVTSVKEAAARTAESVSFGSDSSVEEDVDISQWIGDGEDIGETRELAKMAGDTQELKLDLTEAAVSDETERGATAAEARAGKKGDKKEPGKLPKITQTSDSTESAAADMLKRLRRFR
jgi:pSer/pThr/pTyr-binding forkhead associated (FHA) protein